MIRQREKQFDPPLTIVVRGTTVDFPNEDKIFHNVFSVSRAARFDLGLYKSGAMKSVEMKRPGTVDVYCNIHPDMVAKVKVLDNAFYTITDQTGDVRARGRPGGRVSDRRVAADRGRGHGHGHGAGRARRPRSSSRSPRSRRSRRTPGRTARHTVATSSAGRGLGGGVQVGEAGAGERRCVRGGPARRGGAGCARGAGDPRAGRADREGVRAPARGGAASATRRCTTSGRRPAHAPRRVLGPVQGSRSRGPTIRRAIAATRRSRAVRQG